MCTGESFKLIWPYMEKANKFFANCLPTYTINAKLVDGLKFRSLKGLTHQIQSRV